MRLVVRAGIERFRWHEHTAPIAVQENGPRFTGGVGYALPVARGPLVVDADLIEAVKTGVIAGAVLDVFTTEPLPTEHPFWAMENVIITTHQGGFCDVYIDYALPTVEANMRCFLNGNIGGMINVVPH